MKKYLFSISLLCSIFFCLAQSPQGFNYQSVVKDASNVVVSNQNIGLQMAILEGSPTGTALYTETFSTTTDEKGLLSIIIGTGATSDDLSAIDWSNGPFYLQAAVDLTNGSNYNIIDASQLMSVPFALYANNAGSGSSSGSVGSPCNSYFFPSMSINVSGFISWFKVSTAPYDWVGLSVPNTTNNTITLDIFAGGTVYLDALSYNTTAGSILTIGEAALIQAIGNPAGSVDVGVRIKSTYPAATFILGEKKASDGRLPILSQCFD